MAELWRTNPRIAGEQFDQEVVLIDIEKGLYFSLRGAAVDLWVAFEAPRTLGMVQSAFPALGDEEQRQLAQAIVQMQAHALIVPATDPAHVDVVPIATRAFALPSVEVFSDLAELIAIDPVHEVDAQEGWPLRPPGFPEPR